MSTINIIVFIFKYVHVHYCGFYQQMSANTEIPLPTTTSFSGEMFVLVRYHANNDVTADVTVTQTHEEATTTVTLAACSVGWCVAHSDLPLNVSLAESVQIDVTVSGSVYLVTGRRSLAIAAVSDESMDDCCDVLSCYECPLLQDEAVMLPAELADTRSFLGSESAAFHTSCDVVNNNMT